MRFRDKRRRHQHWQATIPYTSGEQFARTYTDRTRAKAFAARQRKSLVVRTTRVAEVNR